MVEFVVSKSRPIAAEILRQYKEWNLDHEGQAGRRREPWEYPEGKQQLSSIIMTAKNGKEDRG